MLVIHWCALQLMAPRLSVFVCACMYEIRFSGCFIFYIAQQLCRNSVAATAIVVELPPQPSPSTKLQPTNHLWWIIFHAANCLPNQQHTGTQRIEKCCVPLWQLQWIPFRSEWLTKAQFGGDDTHTHTHNKMKWNFQAQSQIAQIMPWDGLSSVNHD